jgi:calcium-dependent phosphoinositide phospholipase C
MNRIWKVGRIVLIVIGVLVAVFALLLFYLWASGRIWYPRQRSRVTALAEQSVMVINEDDLAVRLLDDGLPLDSLRLIASHNSYHLEPDWIRRVLIGLPEPEEPAKLRYSHQTLWDQLDNGVRSFELDIRARNNRFTITHVPLVDNRGPNPDMSLALREIVLWSERHRNHVPIIVLLELKSDWMFLDPGLKQWDSGALDRLDSVVMDMIPAAQLLTPAMVRREAATLVEAVDRYGWPTLGESRGRIVLVVHTDDTIDPLYVDADPGLSDRPMFTSRPGAEGSPGDQAMADDQRPDAVFVIHNDPDPDSIAALTAQHFMVRTRADGDGSYTPEQRAVALSSGAQIVSTDLPPGHPNDSDKGVVEFAPGKTLFQVWGP